MIKTESLKKTEKISSATYLITGFFDDKEPLKWKLRSLASDLVSVSIFIKDSEVLREEKTLSDIRKLMLEISALFAVAKNAGLVSDMNYEILNRELDKFLLALVGEGNVLAAQTSPVLSENFFFVPKELTASADTHIKDKTESGREILKDAVSASERVARETAPRPDESASTNGFQLLPSVPKKAEDSRGSSKEVRDANLKDFGAVAVKKNGRQSVIINLLKRKKEIMIKDVSPLIDGVSEKTIQRELLAMVRMGILRKEGEKRWSRYSLA
ncbi:MAG: seg [Parcubacteria group bacterium]|nr:seg [Parcubacteria group bacterium]